MMELKNSLKTIFGVLLSVFLIALTGCNSSNPAAVQKKQKSSNPDKTSWHKGFPESWWKEVQRDPAKYWEILPQDAGYMEVILSERNELRLLSNFTETPFVFHGVCYPTIESFWQMMKFPETTNDPRWSWTQAWPWTREQVAGMNGHGARAAGNFANTLMEKNEANWATFEGQRFTLVSQTQDIHYNLILQALQEKIRQNPEVYEVLVKTKNLKLRPDHTISEKSPKEWHSYQLWTDIRQSIAAKKFDTKTQENLSLRTCKAKEN